MKDEFWLFFMTISGTYFTCRNVEKTTGENFGSYLGPLEDGAGSVDIGDGKRTSWVLIQKSTRIIQELESLSPSVRDRCNNLEILNAIDNARARYFQG